MNKHEPDELKNALREWRVQATLPPRFQQRVWARIESAESRSLSLMDALMGWAEQLFAKPAVALAYVSALMILGTAVGVSQARQESERVQHQLSARYVQTLDPYASAGH